MRVPSEILAKGFEIGFSYRKETYWDKPSISLPCSVILKTGEHFDMADIVFTENYLSPHLRQFEIEEVLEISESPFALSLEMRQASFDTPEYRNDWPFFYRTKSSKIFGFNASKPMNFTYNRDVLPVDILEIVDFDIAQKEGFQFIENHSGVPIYILAGFEKETIDLIEDQIKTAANSAYK